MIKIYRQGFTLIEVLVVLSLVSILLMLAAPNFQNFLHNSRLSSQTNTLVAALYSAKGEAIKHNMPSYLIPTNGSNWEQGWMVYIDKNFNQIYDSVNDPLILKTDPLPSNFKLVGNGTAVPGTPYVSFDGSGFPRSKNSGPANLVLNLTFERADESKTSQSTRNIIISRTGRVRSCTPTNDSDTNCSLSTTE